MDEMNTFRGLTHSKQQSRVTITLVKQNAGGKRRRRRRRVSGERKTREESKKIYNTPA
jgi:hypothetical protein